MNEQFSTREVLTSELLNILKNYDLTFQLNKLVIQKLANQLNPNAIFLLPTSLDSENDNKHNLQSNMLLLNNFQEMLNIYDSESISAKELIVLFADVIIETFTNSQQTINAYIQNLQLRFMEFSTHFKLPYSEQTIAITRRSNPQLAETYEANRSFWNNSSTRQLPG